MTDNTDQVEFLNYFLDDGNSFDYAVLIDAPWGSGKTHFLRKYLNEKYPGPKAAGVPADYLWVSLFGKSSASEIQDALYAAAHPMLSSKWVTLGGKVGAQMLKKFAGVEADKLGAESFMPEIKAKLVVFDDLERTSIKPADALGLINSFVESKAFKVVVIANQQPFADDDDYRAQKEKVIGRTLRVTSSPQDVLTALIDGLLSAEAKAAVNSNETDVLAVFRASGLINFRSLRAALADFDRLVLKADKKLSGKPEALRSLLLIMVALGIEIRADRLRLEHLEGLDHGEGFERGKGGTPEGKALIARYPMVDWLMPVVSPLLIGTLATSGVLALAEIDLALGKHPLIVGWQEAPLWRTFYSWMFLPAATYGLIRADVMDSFAKFKVTHPGEILHFAGIAVSLAKCGDMLFANIETGFATYVYDLMVEGKIVPDMSVFDRFDADGWGGSGYQEQEDSTFKAIRRHVRYAVKNAHRMKLANDAIGLVARLQSGDSYASLHEVSQDQSGYGDVAVLQYVPVSDMADILIKDHLINRELMSALDQRYFQGRAYDELAEEEAWLGDLEAEMRARAAVAPPPFEAILNSRMKGRFPAMNKNMASIVSNAKR